MPELPEIESLRRSLEPLLIGRRILCVKVITPKIVSGAGNIRKPSTRKAAAFASGLKGEKFSDVYRRGKNLLFMFEGGKILLAHLKMTGQFIYSADAQYAAAKNLQTKHTHAVFRLDKGTLFYNDIRTFGHLLFFMDSEALERNGYFKKIGKDPLDPSLTETGFSDCLKAHKGTLKAVLLGQKAIAGIGNIYADEICFEARVAPIRKIGSLSREESKRLFAATLKILHAAIEKNGSTIENFRLADGSSGNYAAFHKVYGRAGKPCLRCGGILHITKIASRTTVFCPKCQR
jgi:formamidopyrimidine-DNA glycosylase